MNESRISKLSLYVSIVALILSVIIPLLINEHTLKKIYRSKITMIVESDIKFTNDCEIGDTIIYNLSLNSLEAVKIENFTLISKYDSTQVFPLFITKIDIEPYYEYVIRKNLEEQVVIINFSDKIPEETKIKLKLNFIVKDKLTKSIFDLVSFNPISDNNFISVTTEISGGKFKGGGASSNW